MAEQQSSTAPDQIAEAVAVSARRIGLIGDNHSAREDGSDLPDEVFEAFDDVDLIVHLGHTGVRERLARGVLDRLEKVAPVLAVRDFSTDKDGNVLLSPPEGERVAGVSRVIEAGGLRIGAIHNLGKEPGPEIPAPPGGLPELDASHGHEALSHKFGGPVDVVAFAGTHRAAAVSAAGVLFVNPGSPTYPKGPGRTPGQWALGTVGILDVHDGVAAYEVVDLHVVATKDGSAA
jgi:putative phosphoesterase